MNILYRTLKYLAPRAGLLVAPLLAEAQPVNLVSVGALRFTINGGSVAAPVTSSFAISLADTPLAAGATVARIDAMTATTLTVTGANWTAGALASPASPYAVRIATGAAAGSTFPIGGNTTDTLVIAAVDFTTLGLVAGIAGDRIRLIPVDTLNTLFGATTFLGGINPTAADVVILSSSGAQLSYYYNTTDSRWVRTTGPTTDRGNIPLPLDGAISVTRKSTAMTLTFIGRVPDVRFRTIIRNAGPTYTHTGFPTNVTLSALDMPTALSGWVSASSAGNADTLSVSTGADWLNYFHNGVFWQRTTGPATNRDAIVILAGTPIRVIKLGAASGTTYLNRGLPYLF